MTLEELRTLKVDFVSVTEGLDFTTPMGRAMAGMLGIFAEFERDVLRERVKAGMAHARAKGIRMGRPATAQALNGQIQQMLATGMSKMAIAKQLGIARKSVYRVIEAEETALKSCRPIVSASRNTTAWVKWDSCANAPNPSLLVPDVIKLGKSNELS
jgi:DNA invertase Pin-like site-specific DNA recombinase